MAMVPELPPVPIPAPDAGTAEFAARMGEWLDALRGVRASLVAKLHAIRNAEIEAGRLLALRGLPMPVAAGGQDDRPDGCPDALYDELRARAALDLMGLAPAAR